MRRFLLSVAALVVGLALVGAADAAHKSSHSSRSYHMTHGSKFNGGNFYKGREHNHWTHRYWWGKYGCYTYYCPSTSCWYYWYQPANCYYPCSYVANATPAVQPVPVGAPTGVTQIVNVANGQSNANVGGGAAPVGQPPAPPPG